jgi:hypothetical protein
MSDRRRSAQKRRCRVLFLALSVLVLAESPAQAAAGEGADDARFREISDLRSRGEFDAAVAALVAMVADSTESGEVVRRAYNQLVWTILSKSDDVSARARQSSDGEGVRRLRGQIDDLARQLGEVVGAALTRFPDLRAGDDVPDPSRVNQAYEPARQRMFGNLQVETDPDSAAVWIRDSARGWAREGVTPLRRDLFPIGNYEVRLEREGYKQMSFMTQIAPNETKHHEVTLARARSRRWWLTRVVAPVVGAAGLITYALMSGDEGGAPPPEPLPGPPDPPSP